MARNKPHKQKFASKHAVAERQQGRVVAESRARSVKARAATESKERRQQQAQAMRRAKQAAVVEARRVGGDSGPPRIVGVVAANEAANAQLVSLDVQRTLGRATLHEKAGPVTVLAPATKQRVTLVVEDDTNEQACLDVAKVADVLVLVIDASPAVREAIRDEQAEAEALAAREDDGGASFASTWFSDIGLCITDFTRGLVAALNAQGAPSVVVVVQGLEAFGADVRRRAKAFRLHERYFQSVMAEGTKVVASDDAAALVRALLTMKLRSLKWREQRPYFVVEDGKYDAAARTLTLSGYLRGSNLSAQQLVHVTNHGTFAVESVALYGDPCPINRRVDGGGSGAPGIVDTRDEATAESLQCIQASDTVEDEGLATEADVAHAAAAAAGRAATKRVRVPAGVSEYQAAWYEFEDGAGEVEDDGDDAHPADAAVRAPGGSDDGAAADDAFVDVDALSRRTGHTDLEFARAAAVVRLERMTAEERAADLARLREEAEEEAWNPDIVDVPVHVPARERFAKYRGLRSFANGAWDPREGLPVTYGHVFQLQGYARIREAAIAAARDGPAPAGAFVTVVLRDVPPTVWPDGDGADAPALLIASGQLQHEQKWSVLHAEVQRQSEYDEPIKSKTAMLAHIGFRKFYIAPLFSDATPGDRAKFARYFQPGEAFRVATFFGPVTYGPCPVLLFTVPSLEEQAEQAGLRLACAGSVMPPNPDRLLLKRAVMTGRVAVVNKKTIVVKYMFFNDDDVRWFQPCDLYTRLGRRGKIVKAVGTHGLYKAAFNDLVQQHDVVCIDLWKRMFPKWTTVAFNVAEVAEAAAGTGHASAEDEDE